MQHVSIGQHGLSVSIAYGLEGTLYTNQNFRGVSVHD